MNTKAIVSVVIAAVCLASGTSASAQSYNNRNDGRYEQQNRYEQRGNDQYGNRYSVDNGDNRYTRGDDRHDRHERWGRDDRDSHHDRGDRYERHGDGNWGSYRVDNRGYNYGNAYDGRSDGRAYYASNRYEVRQGAYLPQEYRSERYVINDWQERRLSAPPRGSHWVSAGNDYVLAAVATGLIAAVLLNH